MDPIKRDDAFWTPQRQDQMKNESIQQILDRPAPPDEPEHFSKATARERPKHHFASLMGGTTVQEKQAMEEELKEAGGGTRDDDLNSGIVTAGVDEDPHVIDPPGSGGPFDALKFPKRLIQQLNRDDGDTLVKWGTRALLEIPDRLMAEIHPRILAKMPFSVLINQNRAIQDKLPADHTLFEQKSQLEQGEVTRRSSTRESGAKTWRNIPSTADLNEAEKSIMAPAQAISNARFTTGSRHEDGEFPRRIALPRTRRSKNSQTAESSNTGEAESSTSISSSTRSRLTPSNSTFSVPSPLADSTQLSVSGNNPRGGNTSTSMAVEKPVEDQGPCTTCSTMGVKCNRAKPECFWCRHAGYECSFKLLSSQTARSLFEDSITEAARKMNLNTDTAHLNLGPDTEVPKNLRPKPTYGKGRDVEKKGNRKRNAKQLGRTQLFDRDGNFIYDRENKSTYTDPSAQEENYHNRPSIRISVPDHLKNLLVDDWENVTKSMLLVPLPSQAPANFILDEYFNEEKTNRRLGSVEADILEEFCTGLKVYFEKSIGKILLYRFERPQLNEVRKLWESGKYKEWDGKGPGDCYGAEHLTRMIINLPEMIAQTNMDTESVSRLKSELSKFSTWLSRNSGRIFCAKYEKPSAEYIESAR
ncbi:hypothetical protein LTR84_006062 [Exophiala bonariae]|uniref:Zn(2)-C6 fungal-type domain-containing protein n=1 Tax=Exophiala bonariae TaxID=1690606 RepID=A0AAV9N252_9EURO|nr:hypothetical protein LTR84_006062 [Exophiala bonariae]